jgi:hypothetical protein
MKSKEEIIQLAFLEYPRLINDPYNPMVDDNADERKIWINAYSQCQEDMADESIRFADWINKNDYEKIHGDRWCKKFMSYTHSTVELFEIFINS